MNRRSLLHTLALSPLATLPAFAEEASAKAVTVDGLEVFRVKANYKPKVLYSHNWVIVRLKTNCGLTGLGEASQSGDDAKVLGYLKKYAALMQGRSIYDIEWLRSAVSSDIFGAGTSGANDEQETASAICAFAALEHALWDIRGKALGVPCHAFFGGNVHPQGLRQYANINRGVRERTPEGFAKMAAEAVAAGMTAIKLAPFDEIPLGNTDPAAFEPHIAEGIARATAVRQAIGPRVSLSVDCHSRLTLPLGLELLKRLEPLNLYWIEEVTPPDPARIGQNANAPGETYANLAAIHKAATMKTAGGEDLRGVQGFFPYIAADAATVYMPDIKRCGGMLEMKKIAAMAEGAGRLVSPHGPASPVGNVIGGQVMTTAPNFNILEMSYDENPWRAELISPPEDLSSGSLHLSDRPGHGITLNEAVAQKYAATSMD